MKIDKLQEEVNKALDEFEKQQLGLAKIEAIEEPEYLNMPVALLSKKSPEELSEAVLLLNRYSYAIQRKINRLNSWHKWARAKIEETAAEYLEHVPQRYSGYERTMIARTQPELCKVLNAFAKDLEMKIESSRDVPRYIDNIAASIREMKFMALKREKQEHD